MESPYEGIRIYHERTKHQPRRFARSPGRLDWESEPDPFRRYPGTGLVRLPLAHKDPETAYPRMFDRDGVPLRPLTLANVACFLELSLGLSAWKSAGGSAWPLRVNPSSGNLHPIECYVVLPPLPEAGLPGGVFHYTPLLHALETRAGFGTSFWRQVSEGLPPGSFLAGLSAVHWREAWKYGERAFRYSHLDAGHAVAALGMSAALLGWKVSFLPSLSGRDVEQVLGFDRTRWKSFEAEEPGPLLLVHPALRGDVPSGLGRDALAAFGTLEFSGEPNLLSSGHREWSVISEVSALTEDLQAHGGEPPASLHDVPFLLTGCNVGPAAAVIRRRRSAVAFDRLTSLPADCFFEVLDRTMPRAGCPPFDAGTGAPLVDLLLFVHRVSGLDPGMYYLVRHDEDLETLRSSCRPFLWAAVNGSPAGLPLYLLERGDTRQAAVSASCDQEIAGDGAFCAAMIARFEGPLRERPFRYRSLHWEAGMIGQVLYLGAEAAGMRGTGMGCFFDDTLHELMGLSGSAYQDLYHFGAGKAVEDPRIRTLPPYHHLKGT